MEVAELLSPATKDFLAGAVGGMAGVLAGQPLDTLRVRIQLGSSSIGQVWRAMAAREGARGLLKGMSYPACTACLQVGAAGQSWAAALAAAARCAARRRRGLGGAARSLHTPSCASPHA